MSNPTQARIPKGNPNGGEWTDTPTAILRSLNRLMEGTDVGGATDPDDAERQRLADEILTREGRPGLRETADRVGAIYDLTTPEQRAAGDVWYDEANQTAQDMVDASGGTLTLDQAAAIIAHTSTRTAWDVNKVIAETVARGGTIEDATAAIRAAKDAGIVGKATPPLQTNWDRALAAKASPDPIGRDNQSLGTFGEGANKTRTFASNIMGDRDGVTVDTHMYRVLGQSDAITGKMKGIPGRIRKDQVYEALSESVRVAAFERGIDPSSLQAATWVWMLENYHPARGGNPGRIDDGKGNTFPLLIEEHALAAAAVVPVQLVDEDEDDAEPLDYFYAQAERLLGLTPPEEDALTAAGNALQARVPKNNPNGGEWVDTPSGALAEIQRTGTGTAGSEDAEAAWYDENDGSSAWRTYTGGGYSEMNETLRAGGAPGQDNLDLANLHNSTALTVPAPTQVYRGTSRSRVNSWRMGQVVADPGWSSTSRDRDTADSLGGGGLMQIRVPAGAKYLPGNPDEAEMIFPPGSKFKVIGGADSGSGGRSYGVEVELIL